MWGNKSAHVRPLPSPQAAYVAPLTPSPTQLEQGPYAFQHRDLDDEFMKAAGNWAAAGHHAYVRGSPPPPPHEDGPSLCEMAAQVRPLDSSRTNPTLPYHIPENHAFDSQVSGAKFADASYPHSRMAVSALNVPVFMVDPPPGLRGPVTLSGEQTANQESGKVVGLPTVTSATRGLESSEPAEKKKKKKRRSFLSYLKCW